MVTSTFAVECDQGSLVGGLQRRQARQAAVWPRGDRQGADMVLIRSSARLKAFCSLLVKLVANAGQACRVAPVRGTGETTA